MKAKLLGNVYLYGLIEFLKYSQFHAWYLLSILLICGGSLYILYFSSVLIDKNCIPVSPHIRRIEIKYHMWNWLYFRNWINPCKCIFPKKMPPEMYGWRRTTFPTSPVIRYAIIFFVILLNCRPPCSRDIAFDLPAGTWAISGCHRWLLCCGHHLSERHCIILYIISYQNSPSSISQLAKFKKFIFFPFN